MTVSGKNLLELWQAEKLSCDSGLYAEYILYKYDFRFHVFKLFNLIIFWLIYCCQSYVASWRDGWIVLDALRDAPIFAKWQCTELHSNTVKYQCIQIF